MISYAQNDVVEISKGDSPLILGMPHTGTYVPPALFEQLNETGKKLADTDWHIHDLYDGLVDNVTSVRALFHRYVIDPNRDPGGQSLYPGQNTTELCPTTDFDDNPIYVAGKSPSPKEIEDRKTKFHQSYHGALKTEIDRVKSQHGFAILYDCHSIRSRIPHLFEGQLPDFNIGTFDGKSCDDVVAQTVLKQCQKANEYTHILNGRFKGGWTTRHYGTPDNDVHAVQMELTQSSYMLEEDPWTYLPQRAAQIRPYLQSILNSLSALNLS
ncbi:MAG: N-formylglutamate deformylase [Acidimicrobiales bacterium]|nr:N-formylglutamate deformylase [Hyphomonadaceae bacterium]RZV36339.1 MAG: N-formylglutamate deformylase [Acidimicrobiales bacterium]